VESNDGGWVTDPGALNTVWILKAVQYGDDVRCTCGNMHRARMWEDGGSSLVTDGGHLYQRDLLGWRPKRGKR
jgi:hypothetical protein